MYPLQEATLIKGRQNCKVFFKKKYDSERFLNHTQVQTFTFKGALNMPQNNVATHI